LASRIRPGDVLGLVGELGSGKTALVQGICSGLGVQSAVTSPSFVLLNTYPGRVPIHHLDLYRIRTTDEVLRLGVEELFESGGVVIVEWAERAGALLPARHFRVTLTHLAENEREIVVSGGPAADLERIRDLNEETRA
jgi:tRNA threonylcarbamoyladenosine biosynthesis protein TsaE